MDALETKAYKDREKIKEQNELIYELMAKGLVVRKAPKVCLLQEGLKELQKENQTLSTEKELLKKAFDDCLDKLFN